MAQHDYIISNQSGAAFRADLNVALAAIATNNSADEGSAQPSTTYRYQLWADHGNGLLKIRNSGNSAWITVGTLADANLGLATAASPSFTGTATFAGNVLLSGTGVLDLPVGTTAQRPGSPNSGMIRFNTSLVTFEGYDGTAWGAIGGGATGGGADEVFFENGQTVTVSYTLSTSKNAVTAGPVTINSGITVTIPSGASWVVV